MKLFLKPFAVALACCLLFACTAQEKNNLSADEFDNAISINDAVQILDVRTPVEYASGHIKSAMLADWNNSEEFNRRIDFIDKTKPVYVYCLAGGRSALAASKLKASGYQQVYELEGGIKAWKAAGKSVEGEIGAEEMSMEAFAAAINTPGTVLVDFGAKWCPPCRKMDPIIKKLETELAGRFSLLKVDGGKDEAVMKAYNVTMLPVFIIFKNGKQVWRKDGVADEKEIAGQL